MIALIDESGRDTDREPAVAAHSGQLEAVVRLALDVVDEARPRHGLRKRRVLLEAGKEEGFDVEVGALVRLLRRHQTDRCDLVVDRGERKDGQL